MRRQMKIGYILLLGPLLFSCQSSQNPTSIPPQDADTEHSRWQTLDIPPDTPVWSFFSSPGGTLYAGVKTGLIRSTDHGQSWSPLYTAGVPIAIYSAPDEEIMLLSLAGGFNSTIAFSHDGGSTWQAPGNQPNTTIWEYLILPNGLILAGGSCHDESAGGLLRSQDGGATWVYDTGLRQDLSVASLAMSTSGDIFALVIHLSIVNRELIHHPVLYTSRNSGESWKAFCWFDNLQVRQMTIDRQNRLYIRTDRQVLYSSVDACQWEVLDLPAEAQFIMDLKIDARDNLILSATDSPQTTTTLCLRSGDDWQWRLLPGPPLFLDDMPRPIELGRDRHLILPTFTHGIYRYSLPIDSLLACAPGPISF